MTSSNPRVFLGGTCNDSKWRDQLIPKLSIDYFNPVVDDWTPECQAEEIKQRELCDYCLYVITPKMIGVYSISEVICDAIKRPDKTIFCFLQSDEENRFEVDQIKSLKMVGKMVSNNGASWCNSLDGVAKFIDYDKLHC